MKVSEIFKSIEGEGIRAGMPATFIRLHGCNLRCSYCDSMYAVEGKDYAEMTVEQIVQKVEELGVSMVTLTGGEPLVHPDVSTLIEALLDHDYYVNVETNGAVDISEFDDLRKLGQFLFYTMDYKCPSSGMESSMVMSNFQHVKEDDVVKFVVGSQKDLEKARQIIKEYDLEYLCNVFISPVFGKIDPKCIVEYVLANGLNLVRIQLQLHKFIWPADMRGV